MKSRERLIELLKTHPEYSARKLAESIGITEKTIEKHLAKLKAEKVQTRVENGLSYIETEPE